MHQIQFQQGLCPKPRWGAYSAPPKPLAGVRGPNFKGKGGERREEEGRREGRGGERRWDERGLEGQGRVAPMLIAGIDI